MNYALADVHGFSDVGGVRKNKETHMKAIKIAVDSAMTVLFLLLMGYHLFEHLHHEVLGAAVFILFLLHNILNWKWYKNLPHGKYNSIRILHTAVNLLLLAAMLCTVVSAVMISRNVFYALGLMNAAVGRRLHMIATVWSFLLAFVHLGLHWQTFVSMFKAQAEKMRLAAPAVYRIVLRLLRLVALALCVYGITAFCRRSLWNEMFLLIEFKFMDFEEPPLHFFADYTAIAALFTALGFYLKKLAVRCALR